MILAGIHVDQFARQHLQPSSVVATFTLLAALLFPMQTSRDRNRKVYAFVQA